jgi:hypothetical protein
MTVLVEEQRYFWELNAVSPDFASANRFWAPKLNY